VVELGDELLTVSEAAALLRVNPHTVYRWIRSGRLPAVRYSRRVVRVRREDLTRDVTTGNDGGVVPRKRPSWSKEKLLHGMGRISHEEAEELRRVIREAKTTSPPVDF